MRLRLQGIQALQDHPARADCLAQLEIPRPGQRLPETLESTAPLARQGRRASLGP